MLPGEFAGDRDRMARFTREAKVLASLNHSNIAAIYGVEERALIMELVEGHDLRGPLPIATALNYARQIAAALDAAHEKGIVHRDLKPANIRITPDGVVKVLDFGLAKIAEPAEDNSGTSDSRTMASRGTKRGVIMGTAAYMAPEQANCTPVDKRADIWSFGVVLWELLVGHRLFEGETVSLTLAGVLGGQIDFDQLPRETPVAVRGLLRRCLDRNVKGRLRDIGEARIVLEATLSGEIPLLEGPSKPGRLTRLWLAWSVAAATSVGLATVAYLHFREKPPAPTAPVRFQILAPEHASPFPYLSPDGRKLVFILGGQLWLHSLESGESRNLAVEASGSPFWSPDSRFIGYPTQGKIKRVEAAGGPQQDVTNRRTAFWGCGTWNRNDMIVFGERRLGLFRVSASGGVPVQITALDPARHETSHWCPTFLPDGRHFVYIRSSTDEGKSAIYLGSVDATPEQQSSKPLVASTWQPGYAPSADPGSGYLLFMRESTLMAQPFDNRRLELKGQAAPVAGQVGDADIGSGSYGAFSASANDVLVFSRGATPQLTWYDREGKILGIAGEPGNQLDLALSPDGTRLALTKNSGGGRHKKHLVAGSLSRRREHAIYLQPAQRHGSGLVGGWEPHDLQL